MRVSARCPAVGLVLIVATALSLPVVAWAGAVAPQAVPEAPNGFAIPEAPAVGVNTVALSDVGVARPPTTPCVVELFARQEFLGGHKFAYAPPPQCPGPWAKIVLEADFAVSAGRQFDRTAVFNIGGISVYFGSTMEPRRTIAPAWHVERDLTDYAALLALPSEGEALIGNVVDPTYTGRLTAGARLLFYPAGPAAPSAPSPHLVEPISNGLEMLTDRKPTLSKTFTLPTNVERLFLDVVAQGQADDEFWYGCLPDQLASPKDERCGGGAFREAEVFVDGRRAGIVPLFPWIFTGGLNPYLWFPTPAPETLNFMPYRVNLTPFAGALDDGKPHKIVIGVVNARNYYWVSAALLVWTDKGSKTIAGRLTRNTLGAPDISVSEQGLTASGKKVNGDLLTHAAQPYELAGYVDTSHGRVTTALRYGMTFENRQHYRATDAVSDWTLAQSTTVKAVVTRTEGRATTVETSLLHYPLSLTMTDKTAAGATDETIAVDMSLSSTGTIVGPGGKTWTRSLYNGVAPTAVARFDPGTHKFEHATGSSRQVYRLFDSQVGCYGRIIDSKDNAVVNVTTGC